MPGEIKAERFQIPEPQRPFPWGATVAVFLGIAIAGSAGYFGYQSIQQHDEQPFKKLKLSVGDFDQQQTKKLTPILREYAADYCEPQSKMSLLRRLQAAGFLQLAADLAVAHYDTCAKNFSFLEIGSFYYKELGAYSKALNIRNRLVDSDPANPNYRFGRGKVYEGMERYDKALVDYISALDLLGRPEQVAAQQFYEIATMYAALGRFCEAAIPLEMFVSFRVENRTPQFVRLINEYRSKGNCKQSARNEATSVRFKKSGAILLVEASLNNVAGVFVLDTGASLVSVTKSFANKANISFSSENEIALQTANGISTGLLATADSIKVGNAYSTYVPVVVLDERSLGSGDNVVGLLGMSFLSRFDLTVSDTVNLRPRY